MDGRRDPQDLRDAQPRERGRDRRGGRGRCRRRRRRGRSGPWSVMTGAERGRLLYRLASILRARTDEVAALESLDAGKPLAATRRVDIPAAIDCLEYYAGWADKLSGEVVPTRREALTYVQ